MKQRVVPPKQVKDAKENGVCVQKGPIDANMPTQGFMTRQQKNIEDADNYVLKRGGQSNHLTKPRK